MHRMLGMAPGQFRLVDWVTSFSIMNCRTRMAHVAVDVAAAVHAPASFRYSPAVGLATRRHPDRHDVRCCRQSVRCIRRHDQTKPTRLNT
jgi:hypothetical protein